MENKKELRVKETQKESAHILVNECIFEMPTF